MTPKATEEVSGVEKLICSEFSKAIVLQDGVRRKALKKKLQKNFAKSLELKIKALLLHPLSKRKLLG